MKGKIILLTVFVITIFILLTQLATAATIHGTIYDLSLRKVNNVLVGINTQPAQKFLAIEGTYSFKANPGNYELTITDPKTNIQLTKEDITVIDEGTYTMDLFITETENFDTILNNNPEDNEINQDIESTYSGNNKNSKSFYALILIIIIFLGIIVYKYTKKKIDEKNRTSIEIKKTSIADELITWEPQKTNKHEKETTDLAQHKRGNSQQSEKPAAIVESKGVQEEPDLEKIMNILKRERRMSQKELRKHFPLSEAKISLMLTELEHKNKIKRIKQGRTNIILLK